MRFLAAALVFLLVACNSELKPPSGILSKEKMQAVLWDILRADELVSYKASVDSSIKTFPKSAGLYKSVLELHQITENEFRKSFRYYETHPKLFKPVIDSLQRKASLITTAPASY